MIGVGVGTENVTDLAVTHLENMLDVLIQRRPRIDQRQGLIAHQVSIGAGSGHRARVLCYQTPYPRRYRDGLVICLHD